MAILHFSSSFRLRKKSTERGSKIKAIMVNRQFILLPSNLSIKIIGKVVHVGGTN